VSPTAPRLLRWILLLTLVSGLAGFAGGLLASRLWEGPPEPSGAFAHFRSAFAREFDLGPDRRRALASVLDAYQAHLEQLQARGLAALEPELTRLHQQLGELLRNKVLPEASRDRYDSLCQSLPFPTPSG
jgi:hypothetical protein